MPLWAGIDEAGYGPQLGPLVVAGTAFEVGDVPRAGLLWEVLKEAVVPAARGSAGRLVVNDSKKVYSGSHGLRCIEEGVLSFVHSCMGRLPAHCAELMGLLGEGEPRRSAPWFQGTAELRLPVASNVSALKSKAAVLTKVLAGCGVRLRTVRAAVVLPAEFNRIVSRTRNKSLLLFQKCGLVLQHLWRRAGAGESHVLVDKHGGRIRYRRLVRDVFPGRPCDILHEDGERSVYRVIDGDRSLVLTFAKGGDATALPTALASMTAKYVRELHMLAFNSYWRRRVDGLAATAGYYGDSGRFLEDIAPVLQAEPVDMAKLIRFG